MKRFDVLLLSLGLVAVVATPVAAGCRSVHRCATPVVVNKVAVVEAVAAYPVVSAFIPTAVVAYGAAYAGQPYQQQFAAPTAGYGQAGVQGYGQQQGQQDSLLAALQRLEQRLGAIEQRSGIAPLQGQAPPMPGADQTQQAPPPVQEQQTQTPPPAQASQGQGGADVLKLFTSRCASCHAKGKEASGGNFVLLNGSQLAPLSAEKQKEVLRQIYSQKMPKSGAKLTDEELGVVVNWLATN